MEQKLNERQERFCNLFALKADTFCNGTRAYLEAFKTDNNATARVEACKLLKNPLITNRINELLEEAGFNDGFVDKQLLALITQWGDPRTKIKAISEYNKLKQRILDRSEVKTVSISQILDDLEREDPAPTPEVKKEVIEDIEKLKQDLKNDELLVKIIGKADNNLAIIKKSELNTKEHKIL